jgi:hydrogenase maturation factor HypF (carbamoyltransferase family)
MVNPTKSREQFEIKLKNIVNSLLNCIDAELESKAILLQEKRTVVCNITELINSKYKKDDIIRINYSDMVTTKMIVGQKLAKLYRDIGWEVQINDKVTGTQTSTDMILLYPDPTLTFMSPINDPVT